MISHRKGSDHIQSLKAGFIQARLCKFQGLLKDSPTVFKDYKVKIIRIHHGCEGGIEKSVLMDHRLASRGLLSDDIW